MVTCGSRVCTLRRYRVVISIRVRAARRNPHETHVAKTCPKPWLPTVQRRNSRSWPARLRLWTRSLAARRAAHRGSLSAARALPALAHRSRRGRVAAEAVRVVPVVACVALHHRARLVVRPAAHAVQRRRACGLLLPWFDRAARVLAVSALTAETRLARAQAAYGNSETSPRVPVAVGDKS
jgi:hypothetical protein